MPITEALGNILNAEYPADDVFISMRDADGILFLVHEVDGASVILVTFSTAASGGSTSTPNVIDHYYGKSADTSGGVWHKTTQAAGSGFTKADGTEDLVAIHITQDMCPDGKPWVKCAVDGAGTVMAIPYGLKYKRTPANLRSLTA